MNPDLLYQWMETIQLHFTNLKKWQAIGLALYSYGVVLAGHSQGSKIAEALAFFRRIPALERRLRRWLSNARIDLEGCWRIWILWLWRSLDAPRAVLLVDETKIADRIGVMMVSLAYQNRAIPLVWRCYRANSEMDYPQQGQVLMVYGLLARVKDVLPANSRPIVLIDPGLGHSSAMFKALRSLDMAYLLRVKQNATFTSRRGQQSLLIDLVKPGEQVTCHGWLFQNTKRVKVSLHLIWELGQAQPWCLATNDREAQGSGYAVRVWQEESFRDLKSGGWQWQCTYVKTPEHAARLILVLAVAYAWMLTQGTFVLNGDQTIQREVYDGKINKYSVFRSGLRFFRRMVVNHAEKIYLGLFFAPLYNPRP